MERIFPEEMLWQIARFMVRLLEKRQRYIVIGVTLEVENRNFSGGKKSG